MIRQSELKAESSILFSSLKIEPTRLAFLYTNKCNMACSHCCIKGCPENNDKLDPSVVGRTLKEAAHFRIQQIGFTGGECMLYADEIIELVRQASNLGFTVGVTTNGFWATKRKVAKKYISLLKEAGLHTLEISYDQFHADQGADIRKLEYIGDECRRLNVHIVIAAVKSPDRIQSNYSNILDIITRLRSRNIVHLRMGPYGRAKIQWPPEKVHYIKRPLDWYSACEKIGLISITPKGDIWPCCSAAMEEMEDNALLSLGNINNNSLHRSVTNWENDLFYTILGICGPKGFKMLAKEYCVIVPWPEEVFTLCDFCIFAARNSKFKYLLKLLNQDKKKLIDRLLRCYEIKSRWGINRIHLAEHKSKTLQTLKRHKPDKILNY